MSIKFPIYLQILMGMFIGIVVGLIALSLNGQQFIIDWVKPWGLILGIDRPLDMLRTSVNVTGDIVVAAMVTPRIEN